MGLELNDIQDVNFVTTVQKLAIASKMDKSEKLRSTVYAFLDIDIVFNTIQRKVKKVTAVIYIIQRP